MAAGHALNWRSRPLVGSCASVKESSANGVLPSRGGVVLCRCRTPANASAHAEGVQRRLKKLGIDHRTERVPYMKRYRPEIRELMA